MVSREDRTEPPEPDCWLHPDIGVAPSPIQGVGLLARAAVPAGTIVSRIGGRLVSSRVLDEMLARAAGSGRGYVDTITVDQDVHLVLPPGTPNGRGNHSCDPNLWWIDGYTLGARRNIAAGEEVTNDYATSTGEEAFTMDCCCASALCRGVISGRDWRRTDLRERMGSIGCQLCWPASEPRRPSSNHGRS